LFPAPEPSYKNDLASSIEGNKQNKFAEKDAIIYIP
jgi:hypothetical protein